MRLEFQPGIIADETNINEILDSNTNRNLYNETRGFGVGTAKIIHRRE